MGHPVVSLDPQKIQSVKSHSSGFLQRRKMLMSKLRNSTANVITFPSGWPNQQLIADSVDVLLINRYIQIQDRQEIYR